jgi:hypothetical protein
VWGVICLAALSLWLRLLGVPSVLYCWTVWLILGQASGAYVGPKTWSVLLMAAAASILAVGVRQDHAAKARPQTSFIRPRMRSSNLRPAGYLGS